MKHESEWRELSFQKVVRFLTQLQSNVLEKASANNTPPEEVYQTSLEQCDADHAQLDTSGEGESLFSLVRVDEDDASKSATLNAFSVSYEYFEFVDKENFVVLTHRHKLLGKGGYSRVYRGTLYVEIPGGEKKYTVAVKVTQLYLNGVKDIDRWMRMVCLWQNAVHPGLVYCYYIGLSTLDEVKGGVNMYTALEIASDGTLDALLKKKERFVEDDIRTILLDLLHALSYLHSEIGVVHNDIKPQNILLFMDESSQRIRYKLSDFDAVYPISPTLSATVSNRMAMLDETKPGLETHVYGTPIYMSPESCRGLPFLPANDVWSVGILTYQLSTGRLPWSPLELQVPSMIMYGYRQDSSSHFGPTLGEFWHDTARVYSDALKDFVRVCLAERASERPSASKLLLHSFFSSTNVLR